MTRVDHDHGLKILTFPPIFANPAIEAEFRRDFFARSRGMVQAALFMGAAIYAGFGLLDLLVVQPDNLAAVLAIRFGGVCPVLLLLAGTVNTAFFRRHAQTLLASGMGIGGLGIVSMCLVTDMPVAGWYYAGLSLVIVYSTSAIRLHFPVALAVTALLVAVYIACALLLQPIPGPLLISNSAFLTATVGVGLFSNYTVELFARQRYAHEDRLHAAMQEANYQRSQADAGNRAKTQFLATMSHELRTPLNAVIGFADVIAGEMLGRINNRKYSEYADHIQKSARHLLAILEDILELAKADAGHLRLHEDVVSVEEALNAVVKEVGPSAGERGVRLKVQEVASSHDLRADPKLVRQLLSNLITNAVKFSSEGGRVQISAGPEADGGYAIVVADKGIGIDAGDLERIFEPFTQVESAFARDHGGAGLGLPLVKKIVDLHDGRIVLDSRLGVGTTVTVRFPQERVLARGGDLMPPKRAAGI